MVRRQGSNLFGAPDEGRPSRLKSHRGEEKFVREFVDEVAPGAQNEKKAADQDVYFKSEELNLSVNSQATYGGANQASYFKLKSNVQTVLATELEDDWIFNLNIGNVMHLQPLSTEEMNLHVDNSHELSRDAMLEKIILLTVSYFCVGTELRFLTHQ